MPDKAELLYYVRQIILPEVGPGGQEKLKQARVLVIGTGGLGAPALTYLARAGVGTIGICDFDVVEVSNLNRQILFNPSDAGKTKTLVSKEKLLEINPHIQIIEHNKKLDAKSIYDIFNNYDTILDCTDNFPTRFLIHDKAYELQKNLVQASIYQWEGILHVFGFATPQIRQLGCLRCLWPKVPKPVGTFSCQETGVIGVIPGILGSLQSTETIKLILGIPGLEPLTSYQFNLLNLESNKLKWKQNVTCPLCSV